MNLSKAYKILNARYLVKNLLKVCMTSVGQNIINKIRSGKIIDQEKYGSVFFNKVTAKLSGHRFTCD